MKTIFKLLIPTILMGVYSCNNQALDTIQYSNETFPISIDSLRFVRNLDYEKIKYIPLEDSLRRKYNDEDINKMHADKPLFLAFKASEDISFDNYNAHFIYVARNDKIPLDAYYEKYYLATETKEGESISILEIGKYEAYFGRLVTKYCEIDKGLNINIIIKDDIEGKDAVVSTERYRVDTYGKIINGL